MPIRRYLRSVDGDMSMDDESGEYCLWEDVEPLFKENEALRGLVENPVKYFSGGCAWCSKCNCGCDGKASEHEDECPWKKWKDDFND